MLRSLRCPDFHQGNLRVRHELQDTKGTACDNCGSELQPKYEKWLRDCIDKIAKCGKVRNMRDADTEKPTESATIQLTRNTGEKIT